MNESVIMRPMRRKDAAAVVRMNKRLALYHGDVSPLNAAFVLRHCFGAHKLAEIHVAETKGTLIGFALTYDWADFVRSQVICTLDGLFIEKEWRSQKIGYMLVSHIARVAMRRGCARVLTSSSTKNPEAKKFYLGIGFTLRSKNTLRYLIKGKALRALAKHTA